MSGGHELTYDEIVDHIVSDKPIPNVVEVPNITLDESLRSASEMAPRPKPWEKSAGDDLQIDMGRSDLSLGSAISDLDLDVMSKYQTMETELDNAMTNPENSQT
ncbi:hypothetical protein HG536_0E04920 [Torulaspora globosa]|uniref:Peroxisomal membrane protein PEX14-like KPWE domain-containing protein n=1 Tax=Torulaspora globosa TaxID=48254 RepID=A0A7G3ZJ95_9SACH|nr:uncharacterized protein HG536_0E04920 [Torulaspora globosa]QLL33581.1 hypothetical protein HG536_0E04920 [Torulaspora globosa]